MKNITLAIFALMLSASALQAKDNKAVAIATPETSVCVQCPTQDGQGCCKKDKKKCKKGKKACKKECKKGNGCQGNGCQGNGCQGDKGCKKAKGNGCQSGNGCKKAKGNGCQGGNGCKKAK